MNEVEDPRLLERSRRGEERAFSELYRRYQAGAEPEPYLFTVPADYTIVDGLSPRRRQPQ